ncbi:serine/threonine protein kinase [Moumouvirus maliensis]|nr:serine/threonine protein kinase [Moumouvirus maliensis]
MYQDKHIFKKEKYQVLNYLLEIVDQRKFKHETLHHAVVIMNRYLHKSEINVNNLYFVGLVSLNLAIKIHEVSPMEIGEIMYWYNDKINPKMYNESFIRQIEKNILETIDYELYNDNAWQYVKVICSEEKIIEQQFKFTYYLSSIIISNRFYGLMNSKELAEKIISFVKDVYSLDRIYLTNDPITKLIYKCYKKEVEQNILPEVRSIFVGMNVYDFIQNKFKDIVYNKYYKVKPELRLYKQNEIHWYTIVDLLKKEVIGPLGKGTYGRVEKVVINNTTIALKMMNDTENYVGVGSLILRELNTLRKLNHTNINKIIGFYYDYDNYIAYFGLEIMEKSLYGYYDGQIISDTRKDLYILQLLRGLKCLHDNKIMHRDLSPSNILVTNDHLQISDFGLSKYIFNFNQIKTQTNIVFSPFYRSIEIHLGEKYTEKADIWACACVIGFILTEQHIFYVEPESEIIKNIFRKLGAPNSDHNSEIMNWSKFDKKYLVYERSGFTNLEQKYPQHAKIIYSMLELNPINRPSIDKILDQFESIIKN